MRKRKRLTALTLAACMAVSLIACGQQKNTESGSQTADAASTAAASETPAGEMPAGTDTASDTAAGVPDWMNTDGDLPIVKEGTEKTLTLYVEQTSEYGKPEDSWFYKFIEEEMNIKLDVTTYTGDNKSEFLSLAFASNELPDIIIGANFSTAELLNYGEVEGQLLDLAPYINETYMPNLYGIYQENPELQDIVMTPSGNVWSLGNITTATRGNLQRFFINYDWLEQCGLEVPATLDEFIDAMRTFKEEGLAEYPIGGGFASEHPGAYILGAMGYVGANSKAYAICLRNGKAVMPLADREAFGDYLKIMNQLYTEGLIHPDFFTMDRASIYSVFAEDVGFIMQAPFVGVPDFTEFWAAKPLTSEWNSTPSVTGGTGGTIGGVIVSANCQEPELAVKFIDWFYSTTEDNYQKSMIGPSSEETDILYDMVSGYEFDENGNYFFPDYENNQSAYSSQNDYLYKKIAFWNAAAFGYDIWSLDPDSPTYAGEPDASEYEDPSVLRKEDPVISTNGQKHFEYALETVLTPYLTTDVYPNPVWMDSEESADMANTLSALRSYAEPEIAKFVTGARPLTDEELNDYFDNLDQLGAADYVKAYQGYMDSVK